MAVAYFYASSNLIPKCYEPDQRLKYSREELLALQYSSVSHAPPHDRDVVLPNTQSD